MLRRLSAQGQGRGGAVNHESGGNGSSMERRRSYTSTAKYARSSKRPPTPCNTINWDATRPSNRVKNKIQIETMVGASARLEATDTLRRGKPHKKNAERMQNILNISKGDMNEPMRRKRTQAPNNVTAQGACCFEALCRQARCWPLNMETLAVSATNHRNMDRRCLQRNCTELLPPRARTRLRAPNGWPVPSTRSGA